MVETRATFAVLCIVFLFFRVLFLTALAGLKTSNIVEFERPVFVNMSLEVLVILIY